MGPKSTPALREGADRPERLSPRDAWFGTALQFARAIEKAARRLE